MFRKSKSHLFIEFKEDCANERDRRGVWQSLTKEGACKTKRGMPLSKKEKGRAILPTPSSLRVPELEMENFHPFAVSFATSGHNYAIGSVGVLTIYAIWSSLVLLPEWNKNIWPSASNQKDDLIYLVNKIIIIVINLCANCKVGMGHL